MIDVKIVKYPLFLLLNYSIMYLLQMIIFLSMFVA